MLLMSNDAQKMITQNNKTKKKKKTRNEKRAEKGPEALLLCKALPRVLVSGGVVGVRVAIYVIHGIFSL